MQTINLQTPGTLEDQLQPTEWKKIKDLKITGKINSQDIDFIRNLPNINKGFYLLDLFECENLSQKRIPDLYERALSFYDVPIGVKDIKKKAIVSLSMTSINLPDTIEHIQKDAFVNCCELKNIDVDEDNLKYKAINGILYNKEGNKLIYCPIKHEGIVNIPEGVDSIEENAFKGCDRISKIIIPTTINKEKIGKDAFALQNNSTEIKWTVDSENFDFGDIHYTENGTVLKRHTPDPCDYDESSTEFDLLTQKEYELTLPNKVVTISQKAFEDCFQLKKIILPESVKNIESYAFINCTHLRSIEFTCNITNIGSYCFSNCKNLSQICCWAENPPLCERPLIENTSNIILYIPKGKLKEYKQATGWSEFLNIKEVETLTKVQLQSHSGNKRQILYSPVIMSTSLSDYIQNEYKNIYRYTIYGTIVEKDLDNLYEILKSNIQTNIQIDLQNSHIKSIKKKMLEDAENLEKILLPNEITTIPYGAFLGCANLKNVKLSSKTVEIGEFAFADCQNLKHIDFGDSIKQIKRGAFWNCKSLESISLGNSIEFIDEDAFRGCTGLKKIYCLNPEPPKCFVDSFQNNTYENAILSIPPNGKSKYLESENWQKFRKIIVEGILF